MTFDQSTMPDSTAATPNEKTQSQTQGPAMLNDSFAQVIEAETSLPNNPLPLKTSGETGVTGVITTNQAFVAALFDPYEGALKGSVPNVLGKTTVDKNGWGGKRWCKESNTEHGGMNWYFTLAAYSPDTTTKQKKDCTAVCGLMLDDLGTKALPLARLEKLPPTYIIETSEGNYQAGYLFDAPVTDFARCEAVNSALVAANLCDPGAKGPTSRWGRLPFASNTKYDPVFQCKLISLDASRRYRLDQIIEGLELAPPAEQKAAPEKVSKAQLIDSRAEDVFVPRARENAVLTALKQKGLYKRPLGGGKHEITCPWVTEHTDQIDHGTAYFEPDDLYPAGGFHCQHSHGQQKRLGALLEFLEVGFKAAKHLATVRLCAG